VQFHKDVGETVQHLLCHLLYSGTFVHCTDWLMKMNIISHGNNLTVSVTSIKPNTAKAVVRHLSLCVDICLKYLKRKFLRPKNTELVLPVERKSSAMLGLTR
jgi:hypothetical protein